MACESTSDTRRTKSVLLLAFLLLTALSGCVGPGVKELRLEAGDFPPRVEIKNVPFFPQTRYHCGPAALAMTLAWSGLPVTQDDITPEVYTPGRKGTLQADILGAARRNGRLAVPVRKLSDLFRELAGGNPVLVFQNLQLQIYPLWHYAVLIGYDMGTEDVILHSGTDRRRVTPLNTFAHTWARSGSWAVVVLPPDRLPVTAGELADVQAAAGLERAGRAAEAAIAYKTIRGRWPNSYAAAMGAGNANYTLKDYTSAREAFMAASRIRPKAAAPWNNLAYALSALGERKEAIAAARQAVSLGGSQAKAYRDTLAKVSAGK